ncbi:3-isopropylmalate dehydrogenase [Oscillospiraceae bacterium HV4-5-C5C]|nr:3-isopropylmalate dehydrogenase [Oscillospiraceae bacterium HV4-5-C5C]
MSNSSTGTKQNQRSTQHIVLLPGDGIGPEVINSARQVLQACAQKYNVTLTFTEAAIGGAAYDRCGHPLPQATVDQCCAADAVLMGAVGGPAWDKLERQLRPESALLGIRQAMGVYCNLRPAILYPQLGAASPLRSDVAAKGMDLLICRELTGGIYFGDRGRETIKLPDGQTVESAWDTERYNTLEIERIARWAFKSAQARRRHLTLVDKANVLESSRLWRETVTNLASDYPEVQVDFLYVDNAAMQLLRRPYDFDVILTSNMFGDILSDEAAEISGSIGLLPSASLGKADRPGLYEPIHGSAPDIAGQGKANPLATILSAAMLLRYSLNLPQAAAAVETACQAVLSAGYRSEDLQVVGSSQPVMKVGTQGMTDAVLSYLK